ncbi:MAG: ExbD/TolR family protein [Aeoliella sp.]
MSINDTLDSVILKRSDDSLIQQGDDDFIRPPRPKRDDDVEMDITPMIDITFLLLIFFLVTSRPDETTSIHLPQAQHGGAVSQRFSTIFSVAEGGLDHAPVYEGDGKVPGNELPTDMEERNARVKEYIEAGLHDGKTDVVIKGDRGISCGDVKGVLMAVSKVDGIGIHLAVFQAR